MRAYELILNKRNGLELSQAEIEALIAGYVSGEVADYQMAAWAMAVYFQGMSEQEVGWLTQAMVETGEQVDLSSIQGTVVDKHSTGGVGDTTTLVLAPLVAAAGVPMAKMSGRGLGHTGGTLDKLESFAGFRVDISTSQFIDLVNRHKLAVIGQTANIAPADGELYALRDVTATVDSMPLIASSIMSKKIAAGAQALVLDVKVGNGAFMEDIQSARQLAQTMVAIGNRLGRKTVAVLSAMDRPLGRTVGNALEVKEAIAVLQGSGPDDLRHLCLELGSHMLVLAEAQEDAESARTHLEHLLDSGQALVKFRELVANQGGDATLVDDASNLPQASIVQQVVTDKSGWVNEIDTRGLGAIAQSLGAGRGKKEDAIDLAVGLEVLAKPGEWVDAQQPLAVVHGNSQQKVEQAVLAVAKAYKIGAQQPNPLPLICDVVE